MTPTASTSNLNAKLSASVPVDPAAVFGAAEYVGEEVGISWAATPIQNSAPPVRIVGTSSRYQGGYRLDV
jgi:hypothetical protein